MAPHGQRLDVIIWLYRIGFLAILLAGWTLASQFIPRNLIPTPLATWQSATTLFAEPEIYEAVGNSLYVYLGGMLIAVTIGLPLGLLAGGIPIVGRTLDPFFNALMATPRVAFIPLIIVLLGLGFQAKISIVALGAVMPILINTYAGVRNGDAELVEMARSAGATPMQVFIKILMPGAAPFIVVGLRLGATIGLINTVVAELYTAVQGLGGLLATYGNTFRMGPYFVVVLTLAHMFAFDAPSDRGKMMIATGFGLAIMAPAIGINYLHQRKSLKLFLIDAGHFAVGMAAVGGVFAVLD